MAYKKYFSHGTSHHLGLDTHDYCDLKIPFEKNNVLTVEPGIYIMEEEFGIRLEDDVVINDSGDPTNLMIDIPIEIDQKLGFWGFIRTGQENFDSAILLRSLL